MMEDSIIPAAKRRREGDDAHPAPARGEAPAPSDVELLSCLPSGSVAWHVPSTAHTGGVWTIVDGFVTPEECAALIAASDGLEELNEPSARYRTPPTNADYRSADAAGVQIPAARDLARRAAIFTGVPANADADCVMLARTARLPPNDDEPDFARDDDDAASVDSEGFLLAPDAGKSAAPAETADATRGDAEALGAALINVHHDHNRDERRSCTVFVYLSDVGEDAGGETFFPCVKNALVAPDEDSSADPVASALASLGARGVHVAWGAAEDAREAAVVARCAERFHSLKLRSSAPHGAPPGVRFAGDGAPGMAVTPKAGRAVVFWNGASAASCPEAWHAPARVRGDAPKWLMTLFKVGARARDENGRATEPAEAAETGAVAAAASAADPADRSGPGKGPDSVRESAPPSAPEPAPGSDSEAEAEAALTALGAAAVASGKPSAVPPGAAAAAAFQSFRPDRAPGCSNPMMQPPTHVVSKRKSLCLVDGCQNSRKTPSSNNRLPLTCPAHAGARAVPYGGVLSRECQACRTFHELGAFDRDNKTCETRLLRKKLRYRARTLGAEAGEEGEGLERAARTRAASGDASAGAGLPGAAANGAWAAVAAVTRNAEGANGVSDVAPAGTAAGRSDAESVGIGRERAAKGAIEGAVEGADRKAPTEPAGAAARSGGALVSPSGEAAAAKPGPRRGRPLGSRNKNWKSKMIAASVFEQQRNGARARRRAEDAAAEYALASLPPHLRAYAATLRAREMEPPGVANLANLLDNPFGYAAVAAAAADAAAAFAAGHGAARAAAGPAARERSESGARLGPGPATAAGAGPFASLGGPAGESYHHAILAAQARAEEQLRGAHAAAGASPWSALGWPAGIPPLGAAALGAVGSNETFAGGLSVAALAMLAGREAGAGGVGVEVPAGAFGGEAGSSASAELLVKARVDHLMRIASTMDPEVAAAVRGAAERAGALGEAGIGGNAAGIAPNQERGCSIS